MINHVYELLDKSLASVNLNFQQRAIGNALIFSSRIKRVVLSKMHTLGHGKPQACFSNKVGLILTMLLADNSCHIQNQITNFQNLAHKKMCSDLDPAHRDWTDGLFTVQILGLEW